MHVKLGGVLFYIALCIFNYFLISILRVLKYTFEEIRFIYTKLELKLHRLQRMVSHYNSNTHM
jgi:hypothetical protein